ncbi:hypothetical protein VST7929_01897 [Vibrio stylophorae]|uniref:Protein SirB1 N-terminal domain-containing protein n=1 Tax=Vibrio stylophorae TaxID=659351 RepID=A0ABN8DVT5_9VIBR|nr:tetratricopeptide repeat protein [Vibrio stylophorae]CAH0534015.1 hypothetical protein VST7929_01897 [Vibrio stylophorae]
MQQLTDTYIDSLSLAEGALALAEQIGISDRRQWSLFQLEKFDQEAQHLLAQESHLPLRLEGLLRLFYREWGFAGDREQYFSSDNVFIDRVIERRRGIPISLGAIFLHLATKLELPISPVGFPTQFLLRVDWPDAPRQFINPFDGEFVSEHVLQAWLKGNEGPFTLLTAAHLAPTGHAELIGRWLAVMKSALMREEQFALALQCSQLALRFSPDDPYEIRDRGFIFQQLDCYHAALSDFNYFIEHCPEDPAADILKAQVKLLAQQPLTIH